MDIEEALWEVYNNRHDCQQNSGGFSGWRHFYQHAEFISSGTSSFPGTLADVGIEDNKINSGFLAFLRLIGTIYFKKHASGFSTTPDTHLMHLPIKAHHYNSIAGLDYEGSVETAKKENEKKHVFTLSY